MFGRITRAFLIIFAYPFSMGCGHSSVNSANPIKDTSTCIFLGYDSLAYYYGNSIKMEELKKGNIYDHIFTSYIIKSIKTHSKKTGFKVAFKPAAAANVAQNMRTFIELFNTNDIQNRYVDSLDSNEKKIFNAETLPAVVSNLNLEPLKLSLPLDNQPSAPIDTGKNFIHLVLEANNRIYAYQGEQITSGSKYNYTTIDKYLQHELKKIGNNLFVVIKPGDEASYKNVVDILDKMQLNNITKFVLSDLTKDEKKLLKMLQ